MLTLDDSSKVKGTVLHNHKTAARFSTRGLSLFYRIMILRARILPQMMDAAGVTDKLNKEPFIGYHPKNQHELTLGSHSSSAVKSLSKSTGFITRSFIPASLALDTSS